MSVTADKPAPYAPAKTILDIVQRYRERGLVFPVNAEVLGRAGVPDSLIQRTIQALQTLDLFKDSGNPTEILEGLRLAPEADYRKRLEDWLRSAYSDIFAFVDPSKDEEVRVRDAFRNYQPIGQQARMVTLFMGLCTAAGLVPDKSRTIGAAPRLKASRPPTTIVRSQSKSKAVDTNRSARNAHGLPPSLAGLMDSLPNAADGWTKSERDKFVTTFNAVLDFAIPITAKSETQNGDRD